MPCHLQGQQAAEQAIRAAIPSIQDLSSRIKFVRADVTDPATLAPAVRGCAGVIFAASASVGWRLPFSEHKDTPPHVDYEGAVSAATAAASEAVPRFVLVSSLAVTRPSHLLHVLRNSMAGRIMDWKLLGEQGVAQVYKTVSATRRGDMSAIIIRPGSLTDDPPHGPGGILVDTDDTLSGTISRSDVAALCVESVFCDDVRGMTFECVNGQQGGNYPRCQRHEEL
eukprot:CAMPEP_0172171722 /NCGR_PEP_ID=MMETSP1050-20130122/12053_1 /TAXON_ID=233186 /ORGANISM="Cryptomonas curvata, Strain CCAP979/52" /LENGTH=224 /DNA_ID=CAMNT_0012843191 /DNA_START=268 /DNA_END=940 /DNA_ORIENTATION=-